MSFLAFFQNVLCYFNPPITNPHYSCKFVRMSGAKRASRHARMACHTISESSWHAKKVCQVDTKSEVIEIEENMNDEINCLAFSDEFMDGSKEVNQVSSSDLENYSQNDEVLLEVTVDVLQPIFKLFRRSILYPS